MNRAVTSPSCSLSTPPPPSPSMETRSYSSQLLFPYDIPTNSYTITLLPYPPPDLLVPRLNTLLSPSEPPIIVQDETAHRGLVAGRPNPDEPPNPIPLVTEEQLPFRFLGTRLQVLTAFNTKHIGTHATSSQWRTLSSEGICTSVQLINGIEQFSKSSSVFKSSFLIVVSTKIVP